MGHRAGRIAVALALLPAAACGAAPTAPGVPTRAAAAPAGPVAARAVRGAVRAPTSAPALVPAAGSGVEVFYRGPDGVLTGRTLRAGRWSAPAPLGAAIVGAPAAVRVGDRLTLVVRRPSGRLAVRQRVGGTWSAWRGLGPVVTSSPAVAARPDGRVELAVRDRDGRVLTCSLAGTDPAGPWRQLRGPALTSAPALVGTGSGVVDVVAAGPAHDVLLRPLGHGSWRSLGGRTRDGVGAATTAAGRTVLAVRGPGRRLLVDERTSGGWSGWHGHGGALIGTPGAAALGARGAVVLAQADAGSYTVWHRGDGGWSAPVPGGPVQPEPPPAAGLLGTDWTALPGHRRVVALTFDAGSNAAGLGPIVRTLQHDGVPATFFLTGAWTRAHPTAAAGLAVDGFVVGDHTDTHPDLTTLGPAAVADQVRTARDVIRRTTGTDPRPLFRFPYGAADPRVLAQVNGLGYVAVRWSVDTLGWQGTSAGITVASVVHRVLDGARPGEIVLMHVGANPTDGSTLDAAALPTVVVRLRAAGYRFVTLRALVGG